MRHLLLIAGLCLSACAGPVPDMRDEMTGDAAAAATGVTVSTAAARDVVAPIVADSVDGAPAGILTDCILSSATEDELAALSIANAGAPSPETVALVQTILDRPDTVACAAQALGT